MHLTATTTILNVSDVPGSIAWFVALGWSRCWTHNGGGMIPGGADCDAHGPATFASVGSGEVEIFLCHNGQGGRDRADESSPGSGRQDEERSGSGGGVWMMWWVGSRREVDAAFDLARRLGVRIAKPPTDEPWGVRECHLVHPDGHTFRVASHGTI